MPKLVLTISSPPTASYLLSLKTRDWIIVSAATPWNQHNIGSRAHAGHARGAKMTQSSTRNYGLEAFLRDLSCEDRLPGSGAAGAIALALAAACAAKAAAISLKHAPENEQLRHARRQLIAYIDAAIEGSDEDSERFARFLRQRSEAAARSVVAADLKLLALVDELSECLSRLDGQLRRGVSGDLVAARALIQAARTIQIENIEELSSNERPGAS
jgi:hypothetical protein